MYGKSIFFLTLFSIGSIIFSIGLVIISYSQSPTNKNNSTTVYIPVKLDETSQPVSMGYTFKGNIKEIKTINDTKVFTLDLTGINIPTFITTPTTEILFSDMNNNDVVKKSTMKDVQQNQPVKVFATYLFESKKWLATKIYIFVPEVVDGKPNPFTVTLTSYPKK